MNLRSFEDVPRQEEKTLCIQRVVLRPIQGKQAIVIDLKGPASAFQLRNAAAEPPAKRGEGSQ